MSVGGAITPLDVMLDAWNLTVGEGTKGSCTMCVATLDKRQGQLSYSNVGDCGLLVIRHLDAGTTGYIRDRAQTKSSSDLRVVYISQQQLKSFNLPYQLGFSDIEGAPQTFETPSDADTASISVIPGDIVILASDGLYDNLELNEIVDEVRAWEKEYSLNAANIKFPMADNSNTIIQKLAERLVRRAREVSLDEVKDSPFAVLAKENDILWSGGMPDDTSIIVGRILTIPPDK